MASVEVLGVVVGVASSRCGVGGPHVTCGESGTHYRTIRWKVYGLARIFTAKVRATGFVVAHPFGGHGCYTASQASRATWGRLGTADGARNGIRPGSSPRRAHKCGEDIDVRTRVSALDGWARHRGPQWSASPQHSHGHEGVVMDGFWLLLSTGAVVFLGGVALAAMDWIGAW